MRSGSIYAIKQRQCQGAKASRHSATRTKSHSTCSTITKQSANSFEIIPNEPNGTKTHEDERDDILWSAAFLREWENTPRTPDNPYRDMNPNGVVQLLLRQQEMLSEEKALNRELHARLDEDRKVRQELLEKSEREKAALMKTIEELTRRISEMTRSNEEMSKSNEELSKTVEALRQQLAHGNSERFGAKSQKGSKKRTEAKRLDQDKDDVDIIAVIPRNSSL